jgi:hypothetical protein
MATVQLLKLTHGVDDKLKDVSDTVQLVLDGASRVIFSYCFRRERLYGQTENKQK